METEQVLSDFRDLNFSDIVRATYTYSVNGSIVSEMNTIPEFPNISIAFSYVDTKHFKVIVVDEYSGIPMKGDFILTYPTNTTMTLKELQGMRLRDDIGLDFSIPKSMILIKQ